MNTEKELNQQNLPQVKSFLLKPKQKKQTFELVWKLIFAGISIVSAILINKIYLYQTLPYFENIRNGSMKELLMYGLPFFVAFTIFDLLVHYIFDDLCLKYFLNTKLFTDQNVQKRRCYSLVKWGYSLIYYGISSVWAFLLLRNTSYFPWWLGGMHPEGDFYNLLANVPFEYQITQSMRVFYILQFGKHFARGFGHIFIKSEGNFFEYALHHGLAIFLIVFSYTMNMWLIGIWVLLVHDISDFWLILGRGYDNYKNKSRLFSYFTYVFGFIFWIGFRIVLFIYSLVYVPITTMYFVAGPKIQQDQVQYQVIYMPIWFMFIMLGLLELMQIYWTYHLIVGVLKRTFCNKVKQTYEY